MALQGFVARAGIFFSQVCGLLTESICGATATELVKNEAQNIRSKLAHQQLSWWSWAFESRQKTWAVLVPLVPSKYAVGY